MQTHEMFIAAVARIVRQRLSETEQAKLDAIKLVYGAGQSGLRGVTYFAKWKGKTELAPFVEVCAFGQESWVQVAGTTIHEIAHVLAGWNAGHGPEWKAMCEHCGLKDAKAAGHSYSVSCFAPDVRSALECLEKPNEGEPVAPLGFLAPVDPFRIHPGAVWTKPPKPCAAGTGTRGGKSRGKGAGSRYRLWLCSCAMPVRVRVASDVFEATCAHCKALFRKA